MANIKGGNTVTKVWKLCEPIVNSLGLRLWDVRYTKEGADWYLRIFIDKDDRIDVSDCEAVSRAVDEPLDELDPIKNSYNLEVCSPGVERELVRDEHFEKYIDQNIKVKMLRPIEGIGREFAGVLKSYNNGELTICDHDGENDITINKKDASWIKADDF